MPDDEAVPLIPALSDFVTQPAFLYRHHWQVGDKARHNYRYISAEIK
jgi:hypothetical protein